MEDISKITKQSEAGFLGSAEDGQQHAGSIDSMLRKDPVKSRSAMKNSGESPAGSRKSSSIFSRIKSGMSQEHQNDQSPHQSSGWISSLAASFRPRRQTETSSDSSHDDNVNPK